MIKYFFTSLKIIFTTLILLRLDDLPSSKVEYNAQIVISLICIPLSVVLIASAINDIKSK